MNIAVIPARFESTRFPGKPLVDLEGQTMIERVWRATSDAKNIDRVIVATEDPRVADVVIRLGGECVLTSKEISTGTDRCYAVIQQLRLTPDIVVNVQGDEPLLKPEIIEQLVEALKDETVDVSTPISPLTSKEELLDQSTVKVVLTTNNFALYFSRSILPFVRESNGIGNMDAGLYWKHIGLYAYKMHALMRHIGLPPSQLEKAESLEQLRLLQDGGAFKCVVTKHALKSVDTPSDAERVRELLRKNV